MSKSFSVVKGLRFFECGFCREQRFQSVKIGASDQIHPTFESEMKFRG